MSAAADGENGAGTPNNGQGVLANLPRTRPQRSSPRRAAARDAASGSTRASATRAPGAGGPKQTAGGANGASSAAGTKTKARAKAGAKPAAKPKAKSTGTAAKPRSARSTPRRTARPRPVEEAVPRQGFETEGERVSGPVAPPGGAEFLATAVEIVGELAKAGFSTGERLVRDAFSRLPL